MSHDIILLIVAGWFVFFLLLGQHVATVLLGTGIVGILLWTGPRVLNGVLGQDVFYTASNYSLSIIPLYLLMAQLLLRGGLVLDLFRVGHRMAGYRRFPLGVATLVIGGLLGAVSGSGAASAASLATLSAPELERVGYSRRFAIGLAVPIGALFIGLLGPGLLCMLVYIGCLALFEELRPEGAAPGARPDQPSELERGALGASLFMMALMLVVFGGIYTGIITVGEAGAVGAFTALVGLTLMRRIGWRDLAAALADSVKISAMLMLIVIGAQIFARFLAFSRLPRDLLALAEPLVGSPGLLVAVLMAVLFIAGMILESAAVILLIVPIVLPMLEAAGIDLLWFGVLASFMIALGLLTPPVGLSAYAAAAAQRHPVAEVFRPAGKFALASAVIVIGATILFPGIVTWLPGNLR
jgi:TRAP-type C4-dicarboxylate transport system permease large subunit